MGRRAGGQLLRLRNHVHGMYVWEFIEMEGLVSGKVVVRCEAMERMGMMKCGGDTDIDLDVRQPMCLYDHGS